MILTISKRNWICSDLRTIRNGTTGNFLHRLFRAEDITKENMRLYHKITHTFENERMPWLVQYGPRSLNFVSKKNENKKIYHENMILKDKIEKAKSSVRRDDILRH
jgi:hypothetical protein